MLVFSAVLHKHTTVNTQLDYLNCAILYESKTLSVYVVTRLSCFILLLNWLAISVRVNIIGAKHLLECVTLIVSIILEQPLLQ